MDMKALTVLGMMSAFSMKLITDPGHIMILLLSMMMGLGGGEGEVLWYRREGNLEEDTYRRFLQKRFYTRGT